MRRPGIDGGLAMRRGVPFLVIVPLLGAACQAAVGPTAVLMGDTPRKP